MMSSYRSRKTFLGGKLYLNLPHAELTLRLMSSGNEVRNRRHRESCVSSTRDAARLAVQRGERAGEPRETRVGGVRTCERDRRLGTPRRRPTRAGAARAHHGAASQS